MHCKPTTMQCTQGPCSGGKTCVRMSSRDWERLTIIDPFMLQFHLP